MADDTENLYDGNPDFNDGANQSGEGDTKPKEELPGMDFVREAEDEQNIQAKHVRRTLDEAEERIKKEKIGRGAKAIYEAVWGTPEDDEIRRKIIEESK